MSTKHQELENRLIQFGARIIHFTENLPSTKAGNHLGGQLLRSGTSPALNYGEAQSAESTKDFVHKMQVVLKELRESFANLKLIEAAKIAEDVVELKSLLDENNQLISIFVASINTAKSRL